MNKIRDAEEESQIQLVAVERLFCLLENKISVATTSEKQPTGVAGVDKDMTKTSGKLFLRITG